MHGYQMIAQIESFDDDKTVLDYLRHYWISENGLASAMQSMWGGSTSPVRVDSSG
jgi:hypothetical protein